MALACLHHPLLSITSPSKLLTFRATPSPSSAAENLVRLKHPDSVDRNWQTRSLRDFHHIVNSISADRRQQAAAPASVPVRVAYELLQAGHRYLDIRTVDKFHAGHAVGAINIPYVINVGSGMAKNPRFLKQVSSTFGKDDEIIIGCENGRLSLMASAELSYAGFTGITDIAGGYSAWAENELPTKQCVQAHEVLIYNPHSSSTYYQQ